MAENNAESKSATDGVGKEVAFTRVFDAPRRLVFKAWTDPKRVALWWGPHGYTNPLCEVDARVGGAICIHMRVPDGTTYPMIGTFQEVVEPERLVFSESVMSNETGEFLFEALNTVTFAEREGKTTITIKSRVIKSSAKAPQYLQGMEAGWTETLERLGAYVANAAKREKS
jgi:uncharacterized protein YndB with AHSA1/START domain